MSELPTHARAVVIGGGVVGASVLYHLARAGWRDLVLIERAELTSGSTWHAAGGMHTVNGDPNVAKLQAYTIKLYREIEQASGQSCGVHITGGLMLAGTPERHDFLKLMRARARYLGLDMELVSPSEAKRMFPLMDERQFVGCIYNTLEGHVDPSGVTQAYAKAARALGATVVRHNRVLETNPRADGGWDIVTEKGSLRAEHAINCGGLWAREVGRMAGLELPVLAMEHQYLITGDVPEVLASTKEMLHIIDFDGEIYMRQEGKGGMLIGTYERQGVPWSERVTPWDFGTELLPNDLERIAASLEVGFRHFPALGRAGIKRVVNGPFTFSPDGNPLVGPVRGLRNYWVACGVMAGFSQGGGVGLALANWMSEGDPGFDVWGMDVARFGDWAAMAYTNAKVRENYSRRFRVRFPNEELPAGRGLRTTPLYDRLAAENAVWGAAYGLEYPVFYAPKGREPRESYGFRRTDAFAPVAREVETVRRTCGMMEISTYAKYQVSGTGAAAWLDRILAGRIPAEGRIALSPMLNSQGRLIGDFTLGRLERDRFFVVGAGVAEAYHMRHWERRLPETGVAIRAFGSGLVGLALAGPQARAVLQRLVREDVSNAAFPFLSIRRMDLGPVPALVGRISFTGDLGYEIWVEPDRQRALFDALREAGGVLGLGLFGARALNAMRLEKGYGSWAREYRPIYTASEAGLDRFVSWSKPEFEGKTAALAARKTRRYALIQLAVEVEDADAFGDEPIWLGDRVVGWVTSGGYGYSVGQSLATGYVEASAADRAQGYAIEILGERRPARRLPRPLFDPDGARLRS
ncbi:MAG: FAD-dependent oxidoreductase [Alphaproteobacteria bacterium]|nr:FAD-dependent oxidoreductase [Alphaproteobacteria bacterium]